MSDQNSSFKLNTFQLTLVDNTIPNYTGIDKAVQRKLMIFPFNSRWIEGDEEKG